MDRLGYPLFVPISIGGQQLVHKKTLFISPNFPAIGVLALNISIGKGVEELVLMFGGHLKHLGCRCGLFFRLFPHIYHGVPNREVCMTRNFPLQNGSIGHRRIKRWHRSRDRNNTDVKLHKSFMKISLLLCIFEINGLYPIDTMVGHREFQ